MSRVWLAALVAATTSVVVSGARADESFDPATYDRKAFEWTGHLEVQPERQWLRQDSAGYHLAYPGETRSTVNRLSAAAELSGVLRHQSLGFNFTGHANSLHGPSGTVSDARMYEAYASWQVNPNINTEIGKRALRWGTGYAWNPVGFVQRPKDPSDPELAREGYVVAVGSLVRSFEGPLQTVALTGLVLPTTSELNNDFGAPGHLNPTLKLYGLFRDTDVNLVYAGRGSRGPRVGFDFARNLGSNLEVHGEWAHTADAPRAVLGAGNTLVVETRSYASYLLGLRYLTERDTTIVFEFYRNGGGYSSDELSAFYDLVRASAANPALSQAVGRAAAQGYARPNPAQRYAYLRVSQKEPFDLVNVTPSLTVISNTTDRSWSLIPELLYTGVKNLELRARAALNRGDAGTEFGERVVQSRVELRLRLYF